MSAKNPCNDTNIIQPPHPPTTTPLRRRGEPALDRRSLCRAPPGTRLASTARPRRRGRPTRAGAPPRSARRRPRRRDPSQKRPRGRRGLRAAMLSMRPPHQRLASRHLCFDPRRPRPQTPERRRLCQLLELGHRRARPRGSAARDRSRSRPSMPAPPRRPGPRRSAPTARVVLIMRHAVRHRCRLRTRRCRRTARLRHRRDARRGRGLSCAAPLRLPRRRRGLACSYACPRGRLHSAQWYQESHCWSNECRTAVSSLRGGSKLSSTLCAHAGGEYRARTRPERRRLKARPRCAGIAES